MAIDRDWRVSALMHSGVSRIDRVLKTGENSGSETSGTAVNGHRRVHQLLHGHPRKGFVGAMATTWSTLHTDNGSDGYLICV